MLKNLDLTMKEVLANNLLRLPLALFMENRNLDVFRNVNSSLFSYYNDYTLWNILCNQINVQIVFSCRFMQRVFDNLACWQEEWLLYLKGKCYCILAMYLLQFHSWNKEVNKNNYNHTCFILSLLGWYLIATLDDEND